MFAALTHPQTQRGGCSRQNSCTWHVALCVIGWPLYCFFWAFVWCCVLLGINHLERFTICLLETTSNCPEHFDKQFFCQAKSILPFLPPEGLHGIYLRLLACVFDSTYAYISVTFPYLICCFILFDINLLVAARNTASANFGNSEFSFVLLKYRAIIPWNFAWNIVWPWNF